LNVFFGFGAASGTVAAAADAKVSVVAGFGPGSGLQLPLEF
jgi:hypothetical protein